MSKIKIMHDMPSAIADTFESTKVIERLAELEAQGYNKADAEDSFDMGYMEYEELYELNEMGMEVFENWEDGVLLVNEDYLEQYAQELALMNCGLKELMEVDLSGENELPWPLNHVDWHKATSEMMEVMMPLEYGSSVFWG